MHDLPRSLIANEPLVRLVAFASVFGIMAAWETFAPRRAGVLTRSRRWPGNLGVVALNSLLMRAVLPTGAVAFGVFVEAHGWGLLNVLAVPGWFAVPLAVVLLDLAIYLQHVAFHAIPALWRLHRMHHADADIDVTTGVRFHPIEIALSMGIKLAVIALLGAPAIAVLVFEVLLNATAMFSHSNARLPLALDRGLRLIVVTPDMHRVHHSTRISETNSNYGFNLPWWDRLFGTYQAQPEAGHDGMTIGVEGVTSMSEQRIDRMLTQPFRVPHPNGVSRQPPRM